MKRVGVCAVALLATALSGCLDTEPDTDVLPGSEVDDHHDLLAAVATDVAGDAYDGQWDGFYYVGGCNTAGCTDTPDTPEALTVPAPWMDLTALRVAGIDGETIRIEIEVNEIEEGFPRLSDYVAGNRWVDYTACFEAGEGHALRCVQFEVREVGTTYELAAQIFLIDERCGGHYGVCWFPVDFDVHYGAPAVITVDVPKSYLAYVGAPPRITSLFGNVFWAGQTDVAPQWHYAYSIATEGDYVHEHAGPGGPGDLVDVVEAVELDITYAPTEEPIQPAETARIEGKPGNFRVSGGPYDRPELDMLSSELWVEDGEVVLVQTVQEMNEYPPFAAHWDTLVAFSGASMIEMGVRKDTNTLQPYGYMGRCIGFHCDDVKELRTTVDFKPGSPATMTVRFPADEFGLDVEGTTINFFVTATMMAEASLVLNEHDDTTTVDVHAMSLVDQIHAAAPYTVGGVEPLPLVDMDDHEHEH